MRNMDQKARKIGLPSEKEKEFEEEVVEIRRISRVVKGGRRIRFRAAVVIGDKKGRLGLGIAKANEVLAAINKAKAKAEKSMIEVPIVDETIPFPIEKKYSGAKIRLLPASGGTGIIAGGSIRPVIELAGINNILSKIIGSANKISNIKAAYFALRELNELWEMKQNKSQSGAEKVKKKK